MRREFEGWARAGGRRVSLSLNRRVARTPPLADRMGRKSLRVSPREGAGLRVGRARWSGHYPRGRERWGGGGQSTSNRAQSPRSLRSVSSAPRGPEAIAADRTPPSIDVNASSSAMRSGGPAIRVAPTGPNRSGTLS